MDVTLAGQQRAQLRTDLLSHRAKSSLNDADCVRTVLRISLDTFENCIGPGARLCLNQRTFNNIVANAGLDPGRLGSRIAAPALPTDHGGYTKADFGYMAGRYLPYRRSFQNGLDISRAVLDIAWSESRSCLVFKEMRRYKTEAGVWRSNDFEGSIFMRAERVLMSLLVIENGVVRLTLLHIPLRHVYGTSLGAIRTSGVVLTHGYPKRFLQPVISAVTIEAVEPSKRSMSPNSLCAVSTKDMPEYAAAAEQLRIAEEHAVVMTPVCGGPSRALRDRAGGVSVVP
jgi:hypothetical protein